MRRFLMATVACCATTLAFSASGVAAVPAPRIIGGVATPIQAVPWQAAVWIEHSPTDVSFCGGVILDATHVLTAAHCALVDNYPDNDPEPASAFTVVTGSSYLPEGDAYPTESNVVAVAADPMYDLSDYDAAVLTLEQPLVLDGVNRAAIALSPQIPATGSELTVSGWGLTDENGTVLPNALQSATVNVTDFAACRAAYDQPQTRLIDGAVLCAAGTSPARDSCQGDSGGPLAQMSSPPLLVGLVSFGAGCGEDGYPGVYTAVSDPSVRSFIDLHTLAEPDPAPQRPDLVNGSFPWMTGAARVGSTLSCAHGDWSNSPSFTYIFFEPNTPGNNRLQVGNQPNYLIKAADVGKTISCRVRAANVGDHHSITANPVGPVTAVVSLITQPVKPVVVTPRDTTRPRAVVTSTKCKGSRCTLHVDVVDDGVSVGVPSLTGTVRTKVTKRCGTHRTCTHTVVQKLKVTRQKISNYFTVTVSKLPRGKHRFSLVAVDGAGNVQSKPTLRTVKGA